MAIGEEKMTRSLKRIFKQRNVGSWLGAIKHSVGQISIYVGFMNLFILLTTLYSTGWVQNNIIRVNYIQFMGAGVVVILLLITFAYLVDMQSYYSFWRKQVGLDKIEKDINAIKKHLGIED